MGTAPKPNRLCCITSCATNSAAPSACRKRRPDTVVLPYAMAYTAPAAPAAMARIAKAIRVSDAAAGVPDLVSTVGGPTSLAELGFDRAGIDRIAGLTTAKPYLNSPEVTRDLVADVAGSATALQRKAKEAQQWI